MYIGSLPVASNRARYVQAFQIIDEDTSEGLNLSAYGVTLSIVEPGSQSVLLTATDGDGIDMADAANGIFELTFTAAQMRTLCAKQYDVGCTIVADADAEAVDQYIIGTLSVFDGKVS